MSSINIDKKWLLNFVQKELDDAYFHENELEKTYKELRNCSGTLDSMIDNFNKQIKNSEQWHYYDGKYAGLCKLKSRIELLEDKKESKWMERLYPGEEYIYCDNCKTQYYEEDLYMGGNNFPKYCPECGAKMTNYIIINETEKTVEFDNIILSKSSYEYLIKQFNELNYETMIKEISRYLCVNEKASIKIYNFIKENINE